MGFMEKVGATLATKYGVVTGGKHEGCQVAMGNPPEKKVEAAYSFSQVIFVEGNEEKGRYNIAQLRMVVNGNNEQAVQMRVFFNESEYSDFDLQLHKEDNIGVKLLKSFFGQKGGASASPQEQKELKFHNMIVFFQNTLACMRKQDVDFFEGYFMDNDVLNDLTKKLIKIYRDNVEKTAQ